VQRIQSEGVKISLESVTDQMLYSRIQTDPVSARDASRWLADLDAQAAASLQS